MKTPELKPCPFCGHTAHVMQLKWSVESRYFVGCGNRANRCIASEHNTFGMFYPSRQDAIDAWNRRAKDED